MTTAAELHALQETDLAMDSAVAKLNEVEAQLGETEELVAARELVEQRRGEVRQIQERQKSLDWDAEEVRQKALEIEGKLYGGIVKNPKELEDLQADLSSLRSHLRKREEALLGGVLKGEIQALEAKRPRQLEGMDRAALSLYQTLRERRQGAAVAVVERGLCQGCRITLPISLLQKSRSGLGLVQCVSSARAGVVN